MNNIFTIQLPFESKYHGYVTKSCQKQVFRDGFTFIAFPVNWTAWDEAPVQLNPFPSQPS